LDGVDNAVKVFEKNTTEVWRFFSKPGGLDLYSIVRWAEKPANLLFFFIFYF